MTSAMHGQSTEQDAGSAPPIIIKGGICDGAVIADASFAEIGALLSQGRIVILKSVFEPGAMLAFRSALRRWARETSQYPHGKSPSSTPEENFHRVDDGVYKSAIAHIFHQYGFNSLDRLENYVREPATAIGAAMLGLQNAVARTNFTFSLSGMRFRVLRYPSGGGFLNPHVHELEPQRVGLILSLTRLGRDTRTGGTYFLTPFGRVATFADHDIGDIMLFRFDLPHGVSVIDEDQPLDWDSESGKWSVVLELRENYYRTQAADSTPTGTPMRRRA